MLEICASGSAASFASIWAGRTYRPTQGTGLIRQLSHPKSLEADVDCEAGERPVRVVGSTDQRNTLIVWQRWGVGHETATSHLLLGGSAVRDLGSLAGWRADEFNRTSI